MLKQQSKLFMSIQFIMDAIAVAVAFMLAVLLRWYLDDLFHNPFAGVALDYFHLLVVILPIWSIVLTWLGMYKSKRRVPFRRMVSDIAKAVFLGTVLLNSFIVVFRLDTISRLVIAWFALFAFAFLLAERLSVRGALNRIRRLGLNYRSVLLVGTGENARAFAQMLEDTPEWGLQVYGYIDDEPSLQESEINGQPIVGRLSDLEKILKDGVIDEVVFFVSPALFDRVGEALSICEELGVQATVSMDQYRMRSAKPYVVNLDGFHLLTYSTLPSRDFQLFAKRTFDFLFSLVMLVVLLPFLLFVAAVLLVADGGPVLFAQTRVGMNGRLFKLYKFRTMVRDAERLAPNLVKLNERDGPVFKIRKDPRVTWLGRWLRRLSLDELPQLVNVVMGDMSLVGPRPPLPHEVDQYKRWQRRRLSMKPGITGLWQISDRSRVDFERWMQLDLEYIDNWSFMRDLGILCKTVVAVIKGEGAY